IQGSRARIAQKITTILTPQNKHPERLTPTFSTHPITKTGDKNKTLSYRWMASLRETIHPA
ncbi:hypothetical protein AB0T21_23780, partial [Escherichia coli]|uniref:hypothetical protein n=2 Tax=Shigella sonnei TaxID=624 RepID=UPI001C0A7C1E